MLIYMLQPFYWEGTTPSAQRFLLLEAEITQGETYCVSVGKLGTTHPVIGRATTNVSTPKISSLL